MIFSASAMNNQNNENKTSKFCNAGMEEDRKRVGRSCKEPKKASRFE